MVYPFHLLRQRYCNHSPLFWRGAGGEAVCFIQVYVSISSNRAHRAIRSIRPIRVRFKNHLQSRVRLLIRALRVIRVRHTPAAKPTGLFVLFALFGFVLKTICRAELGFSLSSDSCSSPSLNIKHYTLNIKH